MIKRFSVFIAFYIVSIVQAFGSDRIILDGVERDKVKSIMLYHVVIQDELLPITDSPATVGIGAAMLGSGLLPTLAVGVVASTHYKSVDREYQKSMEPLLNASQQIDFRKIAKSGVIDFFIKNYSVPNQDSISVEKYVLTRADIKKRISKVPEADYFLYLTTSYSLVDDSRMLKTFTDALLYGRRLSAKGESIIYPVYANRLIYESEKIGAGGENSILLWAKNNAELLQNKYEESVAETVKLLKYDLSNSDDYECGTSVVFTNAALKDPEMVTGVLIFRNDSRSYVRRYTTEYLASVAGKVKSTHNTRIKKCKDNKAQEREIN